MATPTVFGYTHLPALLQAIGNPLADEVRVTLFTRPPTMDDIARLLRQVRAEHPDLTEHEISGIVWRTIQASLPRPEPPSITFHEARQHAVGAVGWVDEAALVQVPTSCEIEVTSCRGTTRHTIESLLSHGSSERGPSVEDSAVDQCETGTGDPLAGVYGLSFRETMDEIDAVLDDPS